MNIESYRLSEKSEKAYLLRESGKTYAEIGKALNVGVQRARELYKKALKTISEKKFLGLSARAENILLANGYDNMSQVKEAVESEKLHYRNTGKNIVYNCGKKTYAEICNWLKANHTG